MEKRNYLSEYVVMTPQRAKEILERNPLNRSRRNYGIAFLVDEILKGDWNGSPTAPVALADDGTIVDGQHRLAACVKANIPMEMYIMHGVPKEYKNVIDTGITRSVGDALCLEGIKNSAALGALIKNCLSLKNIGIVGIGAKRAKISNATVIAYYSNNRNLCEDVLKFSQKIYLQGRYLTKGLIGGTILFLILEKRHKRATVFGFFEEFVLSSESKIIPWLRNRLAVANSQNRAQRLTDNEKLILLSKVWNLYIQGKDANAVHFTKNDSIDFK